MKLLLGVLIGVVVVLAVCLAVVIQGCTDEIVAAIKDKPLANALYGKFATGQCKADLPASDPLASGRAVPTAADIETARRNQAHTHGDDES